MYSINKINKITAKDSEVYYMFFLYKKHEAGITGPVDCLLTEEILKKIKKLNP